MSEIDRWHFEIELYYQVRCQKCGWETSADGTKEQAVVELKRLGWQLRSNGPWCPECVMQDEMSRDNSVVSPK